jgi:hypothetical protein
VPLAIAFRSRAGLSVVAREVRSLYYYLVLCRPEIFYEQAVRLIIQKIGGFPKIWKAAVARAGKCLSLKLYFLAIERRLSVGIAVAQNVSTDSALLVVA